MAAKTTSRLCLLAALFVSPLCRGEPTPFGPTGLINMPDARTALDGTWRIGMSFADPYVTFWSSATVLPRVEFNGAVTRIMHVPGFADTKTFSDYGDYKDKTTGAKLILLPESESLPALAVGAQDFVGTSLFGSRYVAASKTFGPADITVGYGSKRIDGVFGGVRYRLPFLQGWSAVAEYDANNYRQDLFSAATGVDRRGKGGSYGLEYRWGWLGAQLSSQRGTPGFIGYVAIPLGEKEFIPKLDEPAPYTRITPRPNAREWDSDPAHKRRMLEALLKQDFKDVRIRFGDGGILEAFLTNSRISRMSRAVGRAARTMLLLSPIETREIRVTTMVSNLPLATYAFTDVAKLRRYFNGLASRKELAPTVAVRYASPSTEPSPDESKELVAGLDDPEGGGFQVLSSQAGDVVSLEREDYFLNKFRVKPQIRTYLNGPAAFQYKLSAYGSYDKQLADKLFLNAGLDLTLSENISSGGVAPPNSDLPHVRSDFAEYRAGGNFKLDRLLLNRYFQPYERVYARATAGIYEEMYAGAGGQVLFLPKTSPWGFDFSLDALRKRDVRGGLGMADYSTVTALGALHYRFPAGVTATVRAGRFLAKDKGARFEFKRRFNSGVELGAWYTRTDANDRQGPAANEGGVYYDKGIFASIPFSAMLTKDTAARGAYSLAPWTRDPGQMVASPGDLYSMMEYPITHLREHDGMTYLGDENDDYDLPISGVPVWERPYWQGFREDLKHSGATLFSAEAWKAVALGVGLTVASAALDRPLDRWAQGHVDDRANKGVKNVGNTLPWLGLAAAGALAWDHTDMRLSNTGVTALQAGVAAGALSFAGKYLPGRSRPEVEQGPGDFHPLRGGNTSLPSSHAAVAWAVATPFAKEYDMPWLYGVAALTNLGRVADRQHWFSDTVAGGLLGYALGSLLWEWHRNPDSDLPRVGVDKNGLTLSWEMH